MKKLTAIVFSVFYLITSVGFSVNMHYCAGKLKGVEVLTDYSTCCDDEEQCSGGCCDDQTVVFQLENEEQLVQDFTHWELVPLELVAPFYKFQLEVSEKSQEVAYFDFTDLPPPKNQQIRLLNCSLTYYG